ncbi:MAG TPA: hypothetical protein VMX56_07800 [Anaerolineales bacterium]|nr:hypothetical protein [Anaerolineales bacterium]
MRIIAGYDPDLTPRNSVCQVLLGGVDVSDYVEEVSVTDAYGTEPSFCSLTLQLPNDAAVLLVDPVVDPAGSIMAIGDSLQVLMGEQGDALTRVFDGIVTRGNASSDIVGVRLSIVGSCGAVEWWTKRVTTPDYILTAFPTPIGPYTIEEIAEDLFNTYGGLAPGEMNLPATGRTLTRLQVNQQAIWQLCCQMFEPLDLLLWWDPVEQELTTLDMSIPVVADVNLTPEQHLPLSPEWHRPAGTRVLLQGGNRKGIHRIEVNPWTSPNDRNGAEADNWLIEGVQWASGSKSDWYQGLHWADAGNTGPSQRPDYNAASPYLWVQL